MTDHAVPEWEWVEDIATPTAKPALVLVVSQDEDAIRRHAVEDAAARELVLWEALRNSLDARHRRTA